MTKNAHVYNNFKAMKHQINIKMNISTKLKSYRLGSACGTCTYICKIILNLKIKKLIVKSQRLSLTKLINIAWLFVAFMHTITTLGTVCKYKCIIYIYMRKL